MGDDREKSRHDAESNGVMKYQINVLTIFQSNITILLRTTTFILNISGAYLVQSLQ
jgi:hypothetical protein